MRKALVGVAAAALLTVGFSGIAGAEAFTTPAGDAIQLLPPPGSLVNTVYVDDDFNSLIFDDGAGNISIEFAPGDINGAAVITPGPDGSYLIAPRP